MVIALVLASLSVWLFLILLFPLFCQCMFNWCSDIDSCFTRTSLKTHVNSWSSHFNDVASARRLNQINSSWLLHNCWNTWFKNRVNIRQKLSILLGISSSRASYIYINSLYVGPCSQFGLRIVHHISQLGWKHRVWELLLPYAIISYLEAKFQESSTNSFRPLDAY